MNWESRQNVSKIIWELIVLNNLVTKFKEEIFYADSVSLERVDTRNDKDVYALRVEPRDENLETFFVELGLEGTLFQLTRFIKSCTIEWRSNM